MKATKPPDQARAFAIALLKPMEKFYRLRLFVTGSTRRSLSAIRNIREICDQRLDGRYELCVVDLYQHPEQATAERIVVAPTLVKSQPLPVCRMVGDLSNTERVLIGLGLFTQPAEGVPRDA
jgi:circadian clock protein KaiB